MRRRWSSVGFAVAVMVVPVGVVAASGVAHTMKIWDRASKPLDAMLAGHAAFDPVKARATLQLYADGADQIAAQLHGKSAEAQDYRARYVAFATEARSATGTVQQPSVLKAQFNRLMGECSSCHNTYRD